MRLGTITTSTEEERGGMLVIIEPVNFGRLLQSAMVLNLQKNPSSGKGREKFPLGGRPGQSEAGGKKRELFRLPLNFHPVHVQKTKGRGARPLKV